MTELVTEPVAQNSDLYMLFWSTTSSSSLRVG